MSDQSRSDTITIIIMGALIFMLMAVIVWQNLQRTTTVTTVVCPECGYPNARQETAIEVIDDFR